MVNYFQQIPDAGQEQASAIAKGFGGGLSQGLKTGLSQQLSGFLQQKKELGKAATNVNLIAKRYGKDAFDAPKLAELQNRTSQLIKEGNLSAQDASLLAFLENDQKAKQETDQEKQKAPQSDFENSFGIRSFKDMPEWAKQLEAKILYPIASVADFPMHVSDALQFGTRKLISLAKGQNDEEFQESESKRAQTMAEREGNPLFPQVKPFTESLLEYTGGRGPGENPFERILQSSVGGLPGIAIQSVSELIDAYGEDLPEWAKPFAEALAFVAALKYGKGRGLKTNSVKANEKLLEKASQTAASKNIGVETVLQEAKNTSGANFDKALAGDATEINKLNRAVREVPVSNESPPIAEKVKATEKTVFNPKEAIKQREAHGRKLEQSPFRENFEIENKKAKVEAGKTPETRAKEAEVAKRIEPKIAQIEKKIDLNRKELARMESYAQKYTGQGKERLNLNIEYQRKAITKQMEELKDLRYELKNGKPRPTETQLEIDAQKSAQKIVDQVKNPTPENLKAFEDQLAKDQRFLDRAAKIKERGEFTNDVQPDTHIRTMEKYQKAYDAMINNLKDEIKSLKGARDAESLKKIADNRESITRLEQRQKRHKANLINQKEKIIALKSIEGPSGALYKNQIRRAQNDLKEFKEDYFRNKQGKAETIEEVITSRKGKESIKESGKSFERMEKATKVGEEVGKNPTKENIAKAAEETGIPEEKIKQETQKLGDIIKENSNNIKAGTGSESTIQKAIKRIKPHLQLIPNLKAFGFHFVIGSLTGVIENETGYHLPRYIIYGPSSVATEVIGLPRRTVGRQIGFPAGRELVYYMYEKSEGNKLKSLRKNPVEYSKYLQSLRKRYGPTRINKMLEYSKS